MNQASVQVQRSMPGSWQMIRTLGGVGAACAILIVSAFQFTLPTIEQNKAEALQAAVFKVLPGATTKKAYKLNENNQFEIADAAEKGDRLVYAGYDDNHNLVGIALDARGQGFQDVIRIIYGYAPVREAVIGIQVLETKETPGLGDKIEKDPAFLMNFEALDVSLLEDGSGIKHPIEPVKNGSKEFPWQIDCITGATISSKAIANILRQSSGDFIPLIYQQLDTFREQDGE